MPNVLIKNEIGEDVEYENVDTVTLRRVEGGIATYTHGLPEPTANWRMIQDYRDTSVAGYPGTPLRALYTIYSCEVANGFLVSSTLTNFGLWLQSTYDAIKIDDRNFTNMYSVKGGALILISSSLYFYETETREVTLLENYCGAFSQPIEINGWYYIGGVTRWLLFNPTNKELTIILDGNGKSNNLQPTSADIGECWLFSFNSYISAYPELRGIYRLDKTTLAFEQLFDEGYRWMQVYRSTAALNSSGVGVATGGTCILDVGDGTVFISSITESNNSGGFLRYDKGTEKVTRITDICYYWIYYSYAYYAQAIGYRDCNTHFCHGYGICLTPNSGMNASKGGLWWYDYGTKEVTQITDYGKYSYWYENDDVLIGTHTTYGTAVFDKTTKTWHVPSKSGTCNCAAVNADGIILGGDNATNGLRYYDFGSKSLTTIESFGPWYFACKVPEGFLLSAGNTSKLGVWLFKTSDKTLTQVWDKGYAWAMKRWNNTVVMGSYQTSVDHNGILLFKDGALTRIKDTNAVRSCYMERVDDGIIVGRDSNTYCYFVNGSTGDITQLSTDNGYFGKYWYSWYGPGDHNKASYDFNRKFGDYRIISGYSGDAGCIFNDVTHQLVRIYSWIKTSEQPSTSSTTRLYLNRPNFYELADSWVFIVGATGYPLMFNYNTGTAYRFTTDNFYIGEQIEHPLSPYIVTIPTEGGFLFFSKKFDYSKQESSVSTAFTQGVLFVDTYLHKVTKVYPSGYYDSYEEAPGGFYIYMKSLEFSQKLYWDAASRTMTQIITEI